MLTKNPLFSCVPAIVAFLIILSGCASNSSNSGNSAGALKAGPGVDTKNKISPLASSRLTPGQSQTRLVFPWRTE